MATELQKKLSNTLQAAMACSAIALGKKLGLFDALAAVGTKERPATPKEVADKAGCKERYVREWLGAMGCGGYIEISADDRFWMTDEAKHEYAGTNNWNVSCSMFLPTMLHPFNDLVETFKKDGPLGLDYSKFGDFYDNMNAVTEAWHSKYLVKDYFPLIGMHEKLESGIKVLDVGCGSGFHALTIASSYSKSEVHGADISEKALAMARNKQKDQAIDNVEFHVADAGRMPSEWTEFFDFITIFDACHDQTRPDLCLKEVYRMLKPGGVFAMLEFRGSSSPYEDKQKNSDMALTFYTVSTFHCLPIGSNTKDALCVGTMWGEKTAKKLLVDAGFKEERIDVLYPPYFPINLVYLCQKV